MNQNQRYETRVGFPGYEARMGFKINGIYACGHRPGYECACGIHRGCGKKDCLLGRCVL